MRLSDDHEIDCQTILQESDDDLPHSAENLTTDVCHKMDGILFTVQVSPTAVQCKRGTESAHDEVDN